MNIGQIRKAVREGYARIAKTGSPCCAPSCGCGTAAATAETISKSVGYTESDISAVPEGANLGLGCGNPVALASLKPGEIVLDLGSGAGFDCFLAANKVGEAGKVIGIDMTPEMIEQARLNAEKGKVRNVEFRLGEIEHLPVADNSVDIIISNCVINLSPDKGQVFKEAYRVLKPGGRVMVSDLVLNKPLPEAVRDSIHAYVGCLAGAVLKNDYLNYVKDAGFTDIKIVGEAFFPVSDMANDPTAQAVVSKLEVTPEMIRDVANTVVSIKLSAIKKEESQNGKQ